MSLVVFKKQWKNLTSFIFLRHALYPYGHGSIGAAKSGEKKSGNERGEEKREKERAAFEKKIPQESRSSAGKKSYH